MEVVEREKSERELRLEQIINDSFIGPILEKRKDITDIDYNGSFMTLESRETGFEKPPPEQQPSYQEVKTLIQLIVDEQNEKFTIVEPELNTEIGYLRLNAVHERVSQDGLTFSIRVSPPELAITSVASMTESESIEVEDLISLLVLTRSNIVIGGGTGSGKTEVQKLLVNYIPDEDKINLIEDTRDSHLKVLYPNKHINSWKTIPGVFEMEDAARAALRNNIIWLMISETRGPEASVLLDGAKTDHYVMTTLHVTGAMNIPSRFIPMIRQSPSYANMDALLLGKEIVEFLRFGIYLTKEKVNGRIVRQIKEIVEFTDFNESGAVGTYLYRSTNTYIEETGEYEPGESFGKLSESSIKMLKNRKLYHLLPDVFNPDKEVNSREVG